MSYDTASGSKGLSTVRCFRRALRSRVTIPQAVVKACQQGKYYNDPLGLVRYDTASGSKGLSTPLFVPVWYDRICYDTASGSKGLSTSFAVTSLNKFICYDTASGSKGLSTEL